MVIGKAKITTKGQITVPVHILRKLGLNPGDSLVFEENDGHIEVLPNEKKITVSEFIKKYSGSTKVKLTQEELNKARKEARGFRYKQEKKK